MLNCFVSLVVFWISRLSPISEIVYRRLLSILISARCWNMYYVQKLSWIRTSSSCVRRFFLSSSLVCSVAFALVDGEQGSDAKRRLASASEGLLNCLARELYATREECANESTSVKDVQNEKEQPIVCITACVYMYLCVLVCMRVCACVYECAPTCVRNVNDARIKLCAIS